MKNSEVEQNPVLNSQSKLCMHYAMFWIINATYDLKSRLVKLLRMFKEVDSSCHQNVTHLRGSEAVTQVRAVPSFFNHETLPEPNYQRKNRIDIVTW